MSRAYSDRELLELFRMLLRMQIREERIHSYNELHSLLEHVDEALAEPERVTSNGVDFTNITTFVAKPSDE